jgi:hypothetical protein
MKRTILNTYDVIAMVALLSIVISIFLLITGCEKINDNDKIEQDSSVAELQRRTNPPIQNNTAPDASTIDTYIIKDVLSIDTKGGFTEYCDDNHKCATYCNKETNTTPPLCPLAYSEMRETLKCNNNKCDHGITSRPYVCCKPSIMGTKGYCEIKPGDLCVSP